jgi:uncharacterized membrane protein YqiK
MTGWEQLVVWLFGILLAAISVCSVAKARAKALADVARHHAHAHVEGLRVMAEAQHGTWTVPREWQEDGL